MSTSQHVYDAFYDLFDKILNTDLSMDITIMQAYQDAPAPTTPYISIAIPTLDIVGHTRSGDVLPDGNIPRIHDWAGSCEVWQSYGDGELLRIVQQRLEFQTIGDYLSARNIAIFGTPPIVTMPRQDSQLWIREFRMEIAFGIGVQANENLGWIDQAQITPTYGGRQ